jgi:hypothetical protein
MTQKSSREVPVSLVEPEELQVRNDQTGGQVLVADVLLIIRVLPGVAGKH